MQMVKYAAVLVASVALVSATAAADPKPGDVTDARVIAEAAAGVNWPVTGGEFGSGHFSPLTQINDKNVDKLGLAWSLDLDSPMGMANEPLVVDGVIYITTSLDRVLAVDAGSGKVLWKYDPQVRLSVMRNSWSARTNRGVAVWEGKVYLATGDCRLFALDAAKGTKLWASDICVDTKVTGSTGAPRIGGGLVYIGYNGSDTGVRGSVVAFDANTGKLVWRHWNVPGDPSKPQESKDLEAAIPTWEGDQWWLVGGGDVWDPITYDASTGLLIYGAAGATPDPYFGDRADMKVSGNRLYAGSIIAVNAKTGEYAWHYQTNIRTENFHVLVTDLTINGAKRHVVMSVPRTGIFYVLDAKTGALISQKSLSEGATPHLNGLTPTASGHNWWPMSYNAGTGLVYVPTYDVTTNATGGQARGMGRLVAWDPIKQAAKWSYPEQLQTNSGVLSTAGNLVFIGEGTGEFEAFQADTGKKLWSVKTNSAIQSVPVSFSLKGEQYVLMPVGLGSASRLFGRVSLMGTPESKRGPSRLYAFKLGGQAFTTPQVTVPRVPKPPLQRADADTIKRGEVLFGKFICGDCHSPQADGTGAWVLNGAIPDLRYMPLEVHNQFNAIVVGGSRKAFGMPGWGKGNDFPFEKTFMTTEEANALHAYLIDLQTKAYEADQKPGS